MLLNISNEESYVKDEVAGAKIIKLPLTLSCSAVFPERLLERRGGFVGKTLHDISNMVNTEALGAIFSYVPQYV